MVKVNDNSKKFGDDFMQNADRVLYMAGLEALRISFYQVPYDQGDLQKSGGVEKNGLASYSVYYRMPYARRWEFARENEPDVNFQLGRKSAYLRDSVKEAISEEKFASRLKIIAKVVY